MQHAPLFTEAIFSRRDVRGQSRQMPLTTRLCASADRLHTTRPRSAPAAVEFSVDSLFTVKAKVHAV